jgi:LL-diaminopimelate aminotransferase
MVQASSKLQGLATGVFNQLAEKKATQLKMGRDVIDLSIGSPDLPPPDFVKEILASEVMNSQQYSYPITATEEFKQAVCYFYKVRYGVHIDSDKVLQLMGSQDGLSHLALAYLDPGDIVIVPNPGYPIYSASVHIAGADMYPIELKEENGFKPILGEIPKEICKKAKMMVLNYPGNPTSSLVDLSFFQEVIQFGKIHDILIVHDFAYSELIFDGFKPLSILSVPGAEEIAIEFNSLSKSFNMAGCRVGYLIGHPNLIEPLAIVKSHIDYGVFYPIQKAASTALTSDFSFLDDHKQTYQRRRDVFIRSLHEIGWKVRQPEGGMFVWGKLPEGWSSFDFSMAAIEKGVIVTPGNAFGSEGEGYVRMALVQSEERLTESAKRISSLIHSQIQFNQ